MQVTEGSIGRVFILRLEDGEELKPSIERFAAEHGIQVGYVSFIGGVCGGMIVTGPQAEQAWPIQPQQREVGKMHEAAAIGLLAPDENGTPALHLHGALGRDSDIVNGCLREGIKTWVTGEVVMYEVLGAACLRVLDNESGLTLLQTRAAGKSEKPRVAAVAAAPEPAGEDADHSYVLHIFNGRLN